MNILKLLKHRNSSVRAYAKKIESQKKKFYNANSKLFICCMPKSGSTFVAKTLSKILNYQYAHFFEEFGMASAQNVSEIKAIDLLDKYLVIHQHLLGTNENIFLLKRFGVKPLILVRNIYDGIVSLREHIHSENSDWPFLFHINEIFFQQNEQEQYDFLIDFAVPWYINFYTSWYEKIKSKRIEGLMLTYEEMIDDKQKFFSKILNFYQKNFSGEEIKKVCDEMGQSKDVRFSVGQKGRGEKKLNNRQKEKIAKMTKNYPNIDFTLIGITHESEATYS